MTQVVRGEILVTRKTKKHPMTEKCGKMLKNAVKHQKYLQPKYILNGFLGRVGMVRG